MEFPKEIAAVRLGVKDPSPHVERAERKLLARGLKKLKRYPPRLLYYPFWLLPFKLEYEHGFWKLKRKGKAKGYAIVDAAYPKLFRPPSPKMEVYIVEVRDDPPALSKARSNALFVAPRVSSARAQKLLKEFIKDRGLSPSKLSVRGEKIVYWPYWIACFKDSSGKRYFFAIDGEKGAYSAHIARLVAAGPLFYVNACFP